MKCWESELKTLKKVWESMGWKVQISEFLGQFHKRSTAAYAWADPKNEKKLSQICQYFFLFLGSVFFFS